MGGIGSKFIKPIRNWNIESRAHKIISRDKPKPAPTYDSTQKQIEIVNQLEPDYKIKAQKKDQQLDDYLKKVFVTSNNAEVEEQLDQRDNPDRPLPRDKLLPDPFPIGHYEPVEVKPGRISLSQAMELLANNKKEPEKYTAEYLAAEYKLEKEVVENILEYYKLFTVYNKKDNYNQDIVASTIPISQHTGVGVPYIDDDEDDPEEIRLRKAFRKPAAEPMPVEEEKKKTQS